jgi:hypothetical protein
MPVVSSTKVCMDRGRADGRWHRLHLIGGQKAAAFIIHLRRRSGSNRIPDQKFETETIGGREQLNEVKS